jgi:outer membrane biosynthesis protein TonB
LVTVGATGIEPVGVATLVLPELPFEAPLVEPELLPEPVEAPEPVEDPEPVEAPEPVEDPEPVEAPEPVEVPELVELDELLLVLDVLDVELVVDDVSALELGSFPPPQAVRDSSRTPTGTRAVFVATMRIVLNSNCS